MWLPGSARRLAFLSASVVALTVCGMCGPLEAGASEKSSAPPSTPVAERHEAADLSNPGKPEPDEAQRKRWRDRLRRMLGAGSSKRKPTPTKILDEPTIVNLRGTHMNLTAVRLGSDGRLERSCSIGLDAALAFVNEKQTATGSTCYVGSRTP